MNTGYLIYPKAKQLFKDNGLNDRIKKLYSNQELPYFSTFYFEDQVESIVNDLKSKGYYEALAKTQESKKYQNLLNQFVKDETPMTYTVAGKDREVDYHRKLEEIVLYHGFQASHILSPQEMANYKEFGFDSLSSFIGTLGAYITVFNRNPQTKGLIWQSKSDDFLLENEITGSEHADLRIYQSDITAHKTIDPFGNETLFRKLDFNTDIQVVCGYCNTEPELLVGILKYINQLGLDSDFLQNPNRILDLLKDNTLSFNSQCDKSSDFLFETSSSFVPFDIPMPILSKGNEFETRPLFNISMESDDFYSMFIDSNEDLVFSRMDKLQSSGVTNDITCRFKKDDVDNLIKGIFMQANRHGGRTNPSQLVDIINFYLKIQVNK